MTDPKLDDKTVDTLNSFFDELDGKPPNATVRAYDKLKKALQNVGLGGNTAALSSNLLGRSTQGPSNLSGITSGSFTGTATFTGAFPINITQSYVSNTAGPSPGIAWSGNTVTSTGRQEQTTWRMVMGLVTDEETGQQKYITKAYYCISRTEAKRNFISEYPDKVFTALFVMNPTEDE